MMNTRRRAAGLLTACVLAVGSMALPTAQAQQPAVAPRAAQVTLKASAPRVDAGKRLVLTGSVRNRPVGTTVALQRLFKYVGVWKTVARVKVGTKGAVRYVDRPRRGGERKYRLVVPERGSRPRTVSKAVTVTVWKWLDLNVRDWTTRRATFQGQRGVRVESGMLLEQPVILSDMAVPEGYMTWYTDGQCTKAEATLQATDSTLGLGHVAFTIDGAVVQERDVEGSTGQRLVVRQDITGSRDIGFTWRQVDLENGSEVTMYDARMYCTFV
jgi:hypothetical protein